MYQYTVSETSYGTKYQKSEKIDLITAENQLSQEEQQTVICFRFPTEYMKYEKVYQLKKIKFMTILQPFDFMQTELRYFLVYKDVLKYGLNQSIFTKQFKREYGYKILLQLALTCDEFKKRNIDWPIISINQLYFINQMIYISLIDYQFNQQDQQSPHYYFYTFIQKYFLDEFPELQTFLKFDQNDDFQILKFLLEKNNNLHIKNYLNAPYESVLQYFYDVKKFEYLYKQQNSVVAEFETPETLKMLFSLEDKIVYKSIQFSEKQDLDMQILVNVNREIELMEQLKRDKPFAICFMYLRIYEQTFLLEKKFPNTLAEIMPKIAKADKSLFKKYVYNIAYKFALALNIMQNEKIIHRDLKPENLFVDSENFMEMNIVIADFDRSKFLDMQNNCSQTNNYENTQRYDPPEKEQTYKYDIFQYGLILLKIANRNKYVGLDCGPRYLCAINQHEQYYGKAAIFQVLSKDIFGEDFINLIVDCLKLKSDHRPDSDTLLQKIKTIYLNSKIQRTASQVFKQSQEQILAQQQQQQQQYNNNQ